MDEQPSAVDVALERARRRLGRRPRPEDLAAVVEAGGVVVDIRPVGLREQDGALPGAAVIDRNQLEWRLDPTSPHRSGDVTSADQQVVLVCDEGYASTLAALQLRDLLGLEHATDLDGGYQGWLQAGRPTF
jgi:rhodanese-related sulfurtransferase